MPSPYPVFLNLTGRPAVVVGAGKVALRKVRTLLKAGARVTVVAPVVAPAFASLPVRLRRERFRPAHLAGACLAFAATDSPATNAAVAGAARSRGIPVNIADDPAGCDFHVPACTRRGRISVAISTGGSAPAVARRLRLEVSRMLRLGYDSLARASARARNQARAAGAPASARRAAARGAAAAPLPPRRRRRAP